MATFSTLQTRVTTNVIDLPTAVANQVPTFVNGAIQMLQTLHNFQVMKAEAQFTTSGETSSPRSHILGSMPTDWKEPRGSAYFRRFIGSVRGLIWMPDREYAYRNMSPYDVNEIGEPRWLLLAEPINPQTLIDSSGTTSTTIEADPNSPDRLLTTMNIEVYPYPDGSSDWSDGHYRINIPYWAYIPALVNSTDANWFTQDGPRAEFIVSYATWQGFMMDWDEQRASVWRTQAFGNWDGVNTATLGGYARTVINLDKGMIGMPSRVLAVRRDVYGPRDQWRQ